MTNDEYPILPPELIDIVLNYVEQTKNFSLILNSRKVCKYWHSRFKNIKEHSRKTGVQIKQHVLNDNHFKTYGIPLLSLERAMYFYKYGGYKYIKYNKLGRVVDVIKCDNLSNILRLNLDHKKNCIYKTSFDVFDNKMNSHISPVTHDTVKILQDEDINNNNYPQLNYDLHNVQQLGNCVIS